jgi:hypothetical protein
MGTTASGGALAGVVVADGTAELVVRVLASGVTVVVVRVVRWNAKARRTSRSTTTIVVTTDLMVRSETLGVVMTTPTCESTG